MRLAGKADHHALIQNRKLERAKEREKTFISSSVLQKVRLASHRPPPPCRTHTYTAQPWTALYRPGDFPHWESITNNLTFHWPLWSVSTIPSGLYLHTDVTPDLELSAPLSLRSPGRFQAEGSVLGFGKVQIEPYGSGERRAAISHDRSMVGLTTGQGASTLHNLLIESQCHCWHYIARAAGG